MRARIDEAVRTLVDETGSVPSFADVARRSGVAVAALRARWRTPSMLAIEVLDEDAERGDFDVRITGDLREDLTEVASQLVRYLATERGLCFLRTVMVATANPLEPLTPGDEVITRRLDGMQRLLDAAHETHLSVRDLVDGLIAPIFLRMTLTPRSRRAAVEGSVYVDKLLHIAGSRTLDGVGGAP